MLDSPRRNSPCAQLIVERVMFLRNVIWAAYQRELSHGRAKFIENLEIQNLLIGDISPL